MFFDVEVAPRGPFDPDYDLWADPPRRHTPRPRPRTTNGPRLAAVCPWCTKRYVSVMSIEHLNHPHYALLCHECRIGILQFIQRLTWHRAMTDIKATRAVFDLLDLDNHLLPE